MRLDVFSDTICPWCFIGKRRLERALAMRPQPGLAIRWRAFMLNPAMPADGMDRDAYLEAKFGSMTRSRRIYDAVRAAGVGEGIAFAFDRIKRTPSTLDSHRLLRLAWSKGREPEILEELFRAYFLEGRNIGDLDFLEDLAARGGLDGSEARAYLASDDGIEAVLAEDTLARRQGVTGVPCFVFNGRFALSGAQEPEVLIQLFDLGHEDDRSQAGAATVA
jgi:predicted DsbA family dithiol-disulfide isomerase